MRFDPARLRLASYPVVRELSLLYGDMDPNWHVNNVAIARLFEEGRVSLLLAVREFCPDKEPAAVVLANVSIDYLAEVGYPGTVQVGVALSRIGATSYRHASALFQNGECVALSSSVMVSVSRKDRKPAPLHEEYRGALSRFVAPFSADAS